MNPTFYIWAKWAPEVGVWYIIETGISDLNS